MNTDIKTQVQFVDILAEIGELDFTEFFVGWKHKPESDLKDIIKIVHTL